MSTTTTTATPRRRAIGGWVAIVAVLLGVAIAGAAIAGLGRWQQRGMLDPDSAGPDGTRALAQILRDHGVTVTVARDRATATRLAAEPGTTLVMPDDPTLSDDAFLAVADAASDLVVVDPASRGIRLLFPGAGPTGYAPSEPLAPDCALPEAQRAGSVVAGALYGPIDGGTGCYPADGGYALLVAERDGARVAAIDGRSLFVNERLAEDGNAALAVNLLGRQPAVVWFVPELADSDLADTHPSLGVLTPGWVTPAILLLILAGIAAAVWQGRRFGPLVAESLPVTVRANETTEGRARLYARSRDAAHAAAALREGALARLRRRLSLGSAATPARVAAEASARTGMPLDAVRAVLDGPLPESDRGLVALSDGLRDLEAAVDAASPTERSTP
jgi:hypothetical protein